MAKKADGQKIVTKTSPTTKTIVRKDEPAPEAKPAVPARAARTADAGIARRVARTDGNGKEAATKPAPEQAVEVDPAKTATDAPPQVEPRAAGVAHHDGDQATLEQLNGQLGAIRGLPQYADLEKELTDRIAALSPPAVKA